MAACLRLHSQNAHNMRVGLCLTLENKFVFQCFDYIIFILCGKP